MTESALALHRLSHGERDDAARLLGTVHPDTPVSVWQSQLETWMRAGHPVIGLRTAGHLRAVLAMERRDYAWLGRWRPVGVVAAIAALAGSQTVRLIKGLVEAATIEGRKAGCLALLAEPQPWCAGAGFVPQTGNPAWLVSPESLRRYRPAPPLRPLRPEDGARIATLFEGRALHLGGSLRRRPADWQTLMDRLTPHGPLHGMIAPAGNAYLILQGGHATANAVTVTVQEWIDDGAAGLASIVTWLAGLQGRIRHLTLMVPPDRPAAALLHTAAPLATRTVFGPCLRVIDPATVLSESLGDVAVEASATSLHVQLPEGRITLPPTTLSALMAGSHDATIAWQTGDLQGDDAACRAFAERWPAQAHFRFPAGRGLG